ncbi:adaptin N terminal region-domain-containing protein, partial [Endogone sp. FLAS-F59071]
MSILHILAASRTTAKNFANRQSFPGEFGLFYHLDKTTVLQEARVFNESPLNPRKCRLLLTKIVYLLYLGEPFGTKEATELFFNVTKLFQSKDTALRQMVYLVIKELSSIAEDVIMVTQSLIKDIQTKSDVIYRANAIRALCKITDPSMIQSVERLLKAAIVDKTPSVSSAALVSSYHLFQVAREVVKRWANEVQEAVQVKPSSTSSLLSSAASNYIGFSQNQQQQQVVVSTSNITQYHALGLLYLIRQHDRMAVSKMVQTFAGTKSGGLIGGGGSGVLRSPFATCLLIRYACKVMEDDPNSTRPMYELLEGWLRHKSDMVNYEAARAICNMRDVTAKELYPAIAVLQLFLSSPKPTLRFAAIRTLNKLAMTHPAAVTPCNLDMENLITDQNRSVATFAITTLLKTGNEASVDRLMKQITGFMSEITDEFKVIVVDAIRSLCLKFPAKQAIMLGFLSGVLRDEGGFEFKRAVVEAIFDLVKFIPESLSHLCEFIEDCEFTKLSVRILHLLGVEGPKTPTPTKYIRYIYNRVILENSIVRAAAVSALAKFGVNVEDTQLKQSVRVLLTRCLDDTDDEVRDRATLFLKVMDNEDAKHYVSDGMFHVQVPGHGPDYPIRSSGSSDSTYSLPALERGLVTYINDATDFDQPFNIAAVPKITKAQEEAERLRTKTLDLASTPTLSIGMPALPGSGASTPALSSAVTPGRGPTPITGVDQQQLYSQQLQQIPELAAFGPLFKSSVLPIELTESETEYVVRCVKHVFAEHILFQ